MNDYLLRLLDICLDAGISEIQYWDMSLDEIRRKLESHKRQMEQTAKEKAVMTWKLADLIGVSVSRLFSKNNRYPSIEDVFPELFDVESKRNELTCQRFIQFATAFNRKFESENNNDG